MAKSVAGRYAGLSKEVKAYTFLTSLCLGETRSSQSSWSGDPDVLNVYIKKKIMINERINK